MSEQEQESVLSGYPAIVDAVATLITAMTKLELASQYKIGELVNSLIDDPDSYGRKRVSHLSKDVALAVKASVSTAALKRASMFATLFSEPSVRRMQDVQLTWSNLTALLKADLTDEDRTDIIDRIYAESLHQNKIKSVVKACIATETTPTETNRTQDRALEKVADMSTALTAKIGDIDTVLTKLAVANKPQLEAYKPIVEQTIANLELLQLQVEAKIAALEAIKFE